LIEHVVEPYDTGDADRRVVEQVFATRHRSTIRGLVSEAPDHFAADGS
jgi:hypothetical protein